MAENNEKRVTGIDLVNMSLEAIFAIKGIKTVREFITRKGKDHDEGWDILEVPTKEGPLYVAAFNCLLGSDRADQGWCERRYFFTTLDEAIRVLKPVQVDGLEPENNNEAMVAAPMPEEMLGLRARADKVVAAIRAHPGVAINLDAVNAFIDLPEMGMDEIAKHPRRANIVVMACQDLGLAKAMPDEGIPHRCPMRATCPFHD